MVSAFGQKLAELYRYEARRAPAHFADAVYNANAHVLLHEDNCFRFEARGSKPDGADGALTVQLLDPDRTEVTAGTFSQTPPDFPGKAGDRTACAPSSLTLFCVCGRREPRVCGKPS